MSDQTYPPGAQRSNRIAALSTLLMLGLGALILTAWLYHSPTLMLLGSASFVICLEVTRNAKMRAVEALSEQRLEKRAAELRESGQRLQGIIESAMDAIITIDEKQNIVYLNPAAERTFGYTPSEILGQPLNLLIPQRLHERHSSHVHRFSATNESRRMVGNLGQLSGLRCDGTEFPLEASISGTEVHGQKLFTAIVRDITERIEAQKEHVKQSSTLH
jgi:PAS domain S-box-containing protein